MNFNSRYTLPSSIRGHKYIHVIVVVLAISTIMYFVAMVFYQAGLANQTSNFVRSLDSSYRVLNQKLSLYRSQVKMLSEVPGIQGIIRAKKNNDFDNVENSSFSQWQNRLNQIFTAKMKTTPVIDQLRFIGVDQGGLELVRVDRRNNEFNAFTTEKMQKKGHRSYFLDALKQPSDVIHVSDITLNREHGEVEVPHVPTIRVSRKIIDNSGKIFGILVMNLDVTELFYQIQLNLPEESDLYINNPIGEFILHPDQSKSFAFEYDKRSRWSDEFRLFKNDYVIKEGKRWLAVSKEFQLNRASQSAYKITMAVKRSQVIQNIIDEYYEVFLGILAILVVIIMSALYSVRAWQKLSAEKNLEKLITGLPFAIFLVNKDRTIELVSDAVSAIFGYQREALLGKPVNTIIPQDKWGMHDSNLDKFFADPKTQLMTQRGHVEGVHKEGYRIPVYISLSFIQTPDGTKAIAAVQDASESLAMLERNNRLLEIMERTTDYICTFSSDGNLAYHNQSAAALFGSTTGSGDECAKILDIYPSIEQENIQNVVVPACKALGIWSGESTIVDQDQHQISVSQVFFAHKNSKEEITHLSTIIRDINELKQREHELSQATILAEAANKAKSAFVANTSHEIRTPLNAIMGLMHLIGRTSLNFRQKDYVEKTKVAADSLLCLINDILDFSKIEAGKLEIHEIPFQLESLLQKISVIMASNLGKKEIELLFDIDARLPNAVEGDMLRLEQILINLTSNAIKFTEHGEVVVGAQVLDETEDRVNIEFSVRDSGVGVRPEKWKQIFEEFSQAEDSTTRDYGGTGLGLSISKKLIQLLGGELKGSSEYGLGTQFSFEIDFNLSQDGIPESGARFKDQHLVIVDASDHVRVSLKKMLAKYGWNITLVDSNASARNILAFNQGVDIWLISDDVVGENFNLVQAIRKKEQENEQACRSVVLMMHRNVGWEKRSKLTSGIEQLADASLTKPLTASAVADAVQAALSGEMGAPAQARIVQDDAPLKNLHLLLVEDNVVNQQINVELLEIQGAEVMVAANGALALEVLKRNPTQFDLVLMDIQMPVMDGYEASKQIRQRLKLLEMPIIALSANAMQSDREKSLKCGMNDHVAKPINIDHLVSTITQYVQSKEVTKSDHELPVGGHSDFEIFDHATALGRVRNNYKVFDKILTHFLEFSKEICESLIAMQVEDDQESEESLKQTQALRIKVHDLKGFAGSVGAMRIYHRSMQIEKMLAETPSSVTSLESDWVSLQRDVGNFSSLAAHWIENRPEGKINSESAG